MRASGIRRGSPPRAANTRLVASLSLRWLLQSGDFDHGGGNLPGRRERGAARESRTSREWRGDGRPETGV